MLFAVYEPSAYFLRVRALGRALRRPNLPLKFNAKTAILDLIKLCAFCGALQCAAPIYGRIFGEP